MSHASRLRSELESVVAEMTTIFERSRREPHAIHPNPFSSLSSNPSTRPQIVQRWKELDPETATRQNRLLHRYERWFSSFIALFRYAGGDQRTKIVGIHASVTTWIKQRQSGEMPKSVPEAVILFKRSAQPYFDLLDKLVASAENSFILVPDTNAIIDFPHIEKYGDAIGQREYFAIIPSTVIDELDKLKTMHANQKLRARVSARIRELKSWREYGDVLQGVKLDENVTVKMLAHEPAFDDTAGGLDPSRNDDRIIAASLEIQREHPQSTVILVTSDLNMQNKATLHYLPYIEPPESAASTES